MVCELKNKNDGVKRCQDHLIFKGSMSMFNGAISTIIQKSDNAFHRSVAMSFWPCLLIMFMAIRAVAMLG